MGIARYQHTKMAAIVPIMVYVKIILNNIPRLIPILGQYSQIGTNTGTVFPDWYQHWDSIPKLVPSSKYCRILPNFNPVALQTAEIWTLKKNPRWPLCFLVCHPRALRALLISLSSEFQPCTLR